MPVDIYTCQPRAFVSGGSNIRGAGSALAGQSCRYRCRSSWSICCCRLVQLTDPAGYSR